MYDRFYDLYYITRLNVRLVNYLYVSLLLSSGGPSTGSIFTVANKLFPAGEIY